MTVGAGDWLDVWVDRWTNRCVHLSGVRGQRDGDDQPVVSACVNKRPRSTLTLASKPRDHD